MMRKIVLIAALLMAAAPALADETPIASARAVDTADAQIREYLDAAASAPSAADEPAPAPADNRPHGEFGVGIGTGGYRHLHAATVVPVGEAGSAAIAISDTRFNGPFGPYKQQSLSLGVALGAGARPATLACLGDRPSRTREPMWVTRMRAGQENAAGAACLPR